MAKGDSETAAAGMECQEDDGEYRRAVADSRRGRGSGTGDPDQAAPMGYRRPRSSVRRPRQPRLRPGHPHGGLEACQEQSRGAHGGRGWESAYYVSVELGEERFLADL